MLWRVKLRQVFARKISLPPRAASTQALLCCACTATAIGRIALLGAGYDTLVLEGREIHLDDGGPGQEPPVPWRNPSITSALVDWLQVCASPKALPRPM